MKKLLTVILLCILFALPGCTRAESTSKISVPDDVPSTVRTEHKVSDYFPLEKDVHIKYKGNGNEYAEYETYVEYVKNNVVQIRNVNPGTSTVNVYKLEDGMIKRVYYSGEVYYRYDFTSLSGDEEVLLKEPIEVGNAWTLSDGSKRSITSVDVDVKTQAGDFKAVEVTTETQDSVTKEYYAKDMGMIKSVFTSKGSSFSVSSEVEKIEKDVPFKHTVRFYFPDFTNDRIVFVDRPVEISTNQDMKYKFQKEMKTIPEGSGLIKVLTPKVQVSSPVLDKEGGTVTVNFSQELVKDMNAGSGLELMIVQCITNTIGNYYQVPNVVINVDGKPYSSGHILLRPGEHFTVDTSKTVQYDK